MLAYSHSTAGGPFIGVVVAAIIYGVSCVQTFYYFTNQNDTWHIKFPVTAVIILDTLHQALITHAVYTQTITDWGNLAQYQVLVWSQLAGILFTVSHKSTFNKKKSTNFTSQAITAFIVQSFLTLRIWRLSGRNIYI